MPRPARPLGPRPTPACLAHLTRALRLCEGADTELDNTAISTSWQVPSLASVAHAIVVHHRFGRHMHVRVLAWKLIWQCCLHQSSYLVKMSVGVLMILYYIALRMITISYIYIYMSAGRVSYRACAIWRQHSLVVTVPHAYHIHTASAACPDACSQLVSVWPTCRIAGACVEAPTGTGQSTLLSISVSVRPGYRTAAQPRQTSPSYITNAC